MAQQGNINSGWVMSGAGGGGGHAGAGGQSYSLTNGVTGALGAVGATGNFNSFSNAPPLPYIFELPEQLAQVTKTIRPHHRLYEHDQSIVGHEIASNLIRNRIIIETSPYVMSDDARTSMIDRYIEWLDGHNCGLYMIKAIDKFDLVISFEMETDMIQFGVALRG